MAEEDNQSIHNENNENNRVRTLRDHMNPTRTSAHVLFFLLMHLILILNRYYSTFTHFSWLRIRKSILAF